ncbi:MAG: DUF3987 domain-containing protein, partial [Bdellovibrionaceae bacterium]|nr:DUF3987 domain-containing protein [Pseudobdellovibrionaceae bacterium]
MNQKNSNTSRNSDTPLPLIRELPPSEKYPLSSLGNILGPAAIKMHEIIKAPDGTCAHSLLGAAALVAQTHRNISIDGRIFPTSINLLTISDSGERKSAADQIALKSHSLREIFLKEKYQGDLEKYELELQVYKTEKERVLKVTKGLIEKKIALENLALPPIKPISYQLKTEEPTYEGLVKMLEYGQPSIGLFSDEGGRFIGGNAMNSDNLLKTISGLSSLWDGKTVTRTRSSEGSISLFGKRVSMHLLVQPMIAQLLLSNEIATAQGFLARTLISFPQSMAGCRNYQPVDLNNICEIKQYHNKMSSLLSLDLPLRKGSINELEPLPFIIEDQAKELWIKFYNKIEAELKPKGPLVEIKGFASKVPEHVLRLAGILSFIDDPNSMVISVDYIISGIQLVEYYISEFQRLNTTSHISSDLILATKLLSWLHNLEFELIYLEKIYQYGPNAIRESEI